MEAPDLGSRRKRLLRRALRARRNRSLVSHFGCETHKEWRETDRGVACHWTPTQRLRSISQRIANRKVGRPFGLSALSALARLKHSCSSKVDRLLLKAMSEKAAEGAVLLSISPVLIMRSQGVELHKVPTR